MRASLDFYGALPGSDSRFKRALIEAARASEVKREFAVVASEAKRLSQHNSKVTDGTGAHSAFWWFARSAPRFNRPSDV